MGRLSEALSGLAEAEEAFAAQGNLIWQTRCAIGRAALLLAGDSTGWQEALDVARAVAGMFERLGIPSRHASALLVVARASLALGDRAAAARAARLSLQKAERLGVPWLLFECHYTLGRVLQQSERSDEAFDAYRKAAEALERVRADLQPEELRVSLVSDKLHVFQDLVLLCLDRAARGDADAAAQALLYAEQAKSRALAEQLTASAEPVPREDLLGVADAHTLERMQRLREELSWLYSRLGETGEDLDQTTRVAPGSRASDVDRLRREASQREAELVRLHRRLQPAGRAQAAFTGLRMDGAVVAAALDQLRQRLPANRCLLEYFQAGDELVVFVVDRERLVARRLGPIGQVEAQVERFDFQMRKFNLGPQYVSTHASGLESMTRTILARLYDLLIRPLADEIDGTESLLVVPHGLLHYVPFHAFVGQDGVPLADRVVVSYAPSASVLFACLTRTPAEAGGLGRALVMGVPDAAAPLVASEVDALRELFGPQHVFSGEQATEATFYHLAPEADLIHLASHAVFREDNPLFSALRLYDGWLSLYDLYALRLRAWLVTLSACETGVSDVLAGDELVGLSRGFFQAGASSLVVSLWAVNDRSTALLMRDFYSHLSAGASPAVALRAAQVALRQQYPHPYYWAPFLVVGRP
jgi:CHAT domain-containing protein